MIKDNLENYKMYNSNMTLYFLETYKQQNEILKELVVVNIISDYGKIWIKKYILEKQVFNKEII